MDLLDTDRTTNQSIPVAPTGSSQNGQAPQFTLQPPLVRSSLDPSSPILQFHKWFTIAQGSPLVPHPETACLSTASLPSGRISSRMVYMKELDKTGFVVYSNFGTSQKAKDLETNKWVSLVFWWEGLQQQIRVEGLAERIPAEESQRYFETRARGSRIGAWASRQSVVLRPKKGKRGVGEEEDDGRKQLEEWVQEIEKRFEGTDDIPVPPFWGGLRVVPESIEFWEGRESRLHDRFVYKKLENGDWNLERLSP